MHLFGNFGSYVTLKKIYFDLCVIICVKLFFTDTL